MSGKRILPVALLLICFMMSACSMQAHSPSPIGGENPASPGTSASLDPQPAQSPSGIIEYVQQTEPLPDAHTMASFPGFLESLSMTLEEIVTVLGTQFELDENKAEGYDTYHFPQYQLSFSFDKISEKLSSISLEGIPYYVYSGANQLADINGDGQAEKIVAYEDQNFEGTLLVIDGATGKASTASLDYFGNYCELKILPGFGSEKENLILINTRGGKEADVFSYQNGVLTSILPQTLDTLAQESLVTIEGKTAVWVNNKANILYLCPLPDRIIHSVTQWPSSEAYRYRVSVKPQASGDHLTLKIKTNLAVKLSDNYNFMESSDGLYCDVAQVVETYDYLGQGKWQKSATQGGSKYQDGIQTAPVFEDLSIAGLKLYDSYETLGSLVDISLYTPEELYAGILIQKEGLRVGISQNFISYLSLEEGAREATYKGLKLSDSRETALSLYGLPDQGFLDDEVWTYYVIDSSGMEDPTLFFNTLNLEFDGDKVCRIWISSYVTAY